MRVWALASCGGLLALTACSSNQSAPPVGEGEQPLGDDALEVKAEAKREIATSSALAAPETATARPFDRLSGTAAGRNALGGRRATPSSSLSELPSRQTAELLRSRLDRIRAQRVQPQGNVTQVATGANPQPQVKTGTTPSTTPLPAGHSQGPSTLGPRGVIPTAQQVVTPLNFPGAPRLAAPASANLNGGGTNVAGIPLGGVETSSTVSTDLTQPAPAGTPSLEASTPLLPEARSAPHGGLASTISLDISPDLSQQQQAAVAPSLLAAPSQPLSARASLGTASLAADATSNSLPPTQERAVTTPNSGSVASQGSAGSHHQSSLTAQVQLTPSQANQPRFSGTQLQPGTVPSPNLHGGSSPRADGNSLTALEPTGSLTNSSLNRPGTSPAAPRVTPAPGLPQSLPLHQGQMQRPQPVILTRTLPANPGLDLVARVAELIGSADSPVSPAAPSGLRDIAFSETIRLSREQILLSQAEQQGLSLSTQHSLKHQGATLCVPTVESDSSTQEPIVLTSVLTSTQGDSSSPVAQAEPSPDQLESFKRDKTCPAGTRPLAQIMPEAATAGTPIPGRVESPTL